ncbi:MAG: class I SAM-dependent methyltransferase [Candidatus Omnitrophota bacterium]
MSKKLSLTITRCRICGSEHIKTFLDLGEQPPANSLRRDPAVKLPVFPLALCRCANCALIQLTVTVNPAHLFKQYVWVTGTSATAREYAGIFFKAAQKHLPAQKPFVVEIASNDGTFLKVFRKNGCRVLGIDPAENIGVIARKQGIPTWTEFFNERTARKVVAQAGMADFVFARNVIPHVADVHGVVAGIKRCLAPEGIGAIEFHYSREIVAGLQYDSIYHEHLFYFSLQSIMFLLKMHGLAAFDIMKSPISGGSLVIYFTHNNIKKSMSGELKQKIGFEKKYGLNTLSLWKAFARGCLAHRKKLTALLEGARAQGKSAIGYGASARSSTLLNYCAINAGHLLCIADKNPLKHNSYTAGTNIRIVSPGEAFALKPDIVVLLAWNFKDEIIALLKHKYRFHGKVIVPLKHAPYTISL